MTMVSILLLLLLFLTTQYATTTAFPTAAGSCPAGTAAVGPPHTGAGRTETTGTLAEGGFTVWLNGFPLGSSFYTIGKEETVELTASSNTTFRGFLVRVGPLEGENVDLRNAIFAEDAEEVDAQVATATCVQAENVGGLTHTSPKDKTNVTGTLLVEAEVSALVLDVTVVGINAGTESSYWYTRYQVEARSAPQGEEEEEEEGEEGEEVAPEEEEESATEEDPTTPTSNETQAEEESGETSEAVTVVAEGETGGTQEEPVSDGGGDSSSAFGVNTRTIVTKAILASIWTILLLWN